MKIVGLTGRIGSGKSTILKVFASLGVPCYDSDTQAKKLMEEDEELTSKIKGLFGDNIYNGLEFNRSLLAELVFSDGFLKDSYKDIASSSGSEGYDNGQRSFREFCKSG